MQASQMLQTCSIDIFTQICLFLDNCDITMLAHTCHNLRMLVKKLFTRHRWRVMHTIACANSARDVIRMIKRCNLTTHDFTQIAICITHARVQDGLCIHLFDWMVDMHPEIACWELMLAVARRPVLIPSWERLFPRIQQLYRRAVNEFQCDPKLINEPWNLLRYPYVTQEFDHKMYIFRTLGIVYAERA